MELATGTNLLGTEKEKILISPTPVILSFFAENRKGTRQEVTKAVFKVANKLEQSNIRIKAIFRGKLKSPETGNIRSETIDNVLWYWFSNDFLRECSTIDRNFCFEINPEEDFFDEYLIENLSKNLTEINWGNEENKIQFIQILQEVIPIAR